MDPNLAVEPNLDERCVVELSQEQVDRVVREATERGNLGLLLTGVREAREMIVWEHRHEQDPRLSQSLLAGLLTLASFPPDGTYIGNAELSRTLGINASTVHRYISTLVAVGLLERDPASRRYRLV